MGSCHVYVHADADIDVAERIVLNAKTRRPSVCNAAETLLVDKSLADTALPGWGPLCGTPGSPSTRTHPKGPARGFLSMDIALAVVDGLEATIDHINNLRHWGTPRPSSPRIWLRLAVYRTGRRGRGHGQRLHRLHRRRQFGFGAEIGISTQKLHARGPMGLPELTSTKWIVFGDGHTRPA